MAQRTIVRLVGFLTLFLCRYRRLMRLRGLFFRFSTVWTTRGQHHGDGAVLSRHVAGGRISVFVHRTSCKNPKPESEISL